MRKCSPAQKCTGTRLQESRIGGRTNRVTNRVLPKQYQLARDDLSLRRSCLVKTAKPLALQSFEVTFKTLWGQIERSTFSLVGLLMQAKETVKIIIISETDAFTLAASNQSAKVLFDAGPGGL